MLTDVRDLPTDAARDLTMASRVSPGLEELGVRSCINRSSTPEASRSVQLLRGKAGDVPNAFERHCGGISPTDPVKRARLPQHSVRARRTRTLLQRG